MERIRDYLFYSSISLAIFSCVGPGLSENAICDPGENRCIENRYQICGDRGEQWVERANCSESGEICLLSTGCLVCSPNSRSCDGSNIVRCNPEGSGTQLLATCDGDVGDVCNNGECINACQLSAQSRDYEGCEYWAVDLDNAVVANQGAASAQQFSVVLSNASDINALVDVEIFCTPQDALDPAVGCTPGEFAAVKQGIVITPGGLAIVDLDPREVDGSSAPNLNDGPGTFRSLAAYRVSSSAPLIAYQFNPLENVNVFSNDASLLLPTSALDDRYIVLGWPQTLALTGDSLTNGTIDLRAFLTVVAAEDNTRLVVDLSTDIVGGADIPAARAGDELVLMMKRGEVINLETDGFNADFSGTEVRSNGADNPIAVFIGSEASDAPFFDSFLERSCCADHMEQQVFPERTYGSRFIAVKTPSRSKYVEAAGWDVGVVPDEPEYWRVMATSEDTRIVTNLPPPNDIIALQRGESQVIVTERDFTIRANSPIAVAQVPGSQGTTGIPSTLSGGLRPPGGDPSLILIPPIEQWRSNYLFLVPNKYAFDFLLMAIPMGAKILYDGLPLDEVLLGCEYSIVGSLGRGAEAVEYQSIRCPLSDPSPTSAGFQDDGVHTLEALGGVEFGLVVWGWDSFVSYGYPGGSNLGLINLL